MNDELTPHSDDDLPQNLPPDQPDHRELTGDDVVPDADLELILRPRHTQQAMEWLAVLGAKGIPTDVVRDEDGWGIHVAPEHEDRARQELDLYRSESKNWPPAWSKPDPEHRDIITQGSLLAGTMLILFYFLTGDFDHAKPAFIGGAANADLIRNGELWRTATALCLHSDFSHITGNAISTILLGSVVARRFGDGVGWALICLSGILGNLATALMYGGGHLSVGASTAVFGALGMAGTIRAVEIYRREAPLNLRGLFGPLLVVLAVIGFMGMGPKADVMAHIMGAVCGLALGFVRLGIPRPPRLAMQALATILTVATFFIAWALALQSATS